MRWTIKISYSDRETGSRYAALLRSPAVIPKMFLLGPASREIGSRGPSCYTAEKQTEIEGTEERKRKKGMGFASLSSSVTGMGVRLIPSRYNKYAKK